MVAEVADIGQVNIIKLSIARATRYEDGSVEQVRELLVDTPKALVPLSLGWSVDMAY